MKRSRSSLLALAAIASIASVPAAGRTDFDSHIGTRHGNDSYSGLKTFGNISAQAFDGGGTSKQTSVVSDKVIGDVSGAARTGGNIGAIKTAAKSAASAVGNDTSQGVKTHGSAAMTANKVGGKKRTGKVGFAAMKPERRREIASLGGRAAHAAGAAHQFNSESGRKAALSKNKSAGAGAASPA